MSHVHSVSVSEDVITGETRKVTYAIDLVDNFSNHSIFITVVLINISLLPDYDPETEGPAIAANQLNKLINRERNNIGTDYQNQVNSYDKYHNTQWCTSKQWGVSAVHLGMDHNDVNVAVWLEPLLSWAMANFSNEQLADALDLTLDQAKRMKRRYKALYDAPDTPEPATAAIAVFHSEQGPVGTDL